MGSPSSTSTPAAPRPVAVRVAAILSSALRTCGAALSTAARRLDQEVVGTKHPGDSAEAPTIEARLTMVELHLGLRDAR